jgi:hypothetical protein
MQTRDNNKKQSEEEKRDLELENIVRNPLIAEYQVDRLRTRLGDVVNGYRPKMMNASTHLFKHNNKWYKQSIRRYETDVNSSKEIAQNQISGYS